MSLNHILFGGTREPFPLGSRSPSWQFEGTAMSNKASIHGEKRVMNVPTHSFSHFYLFIYLSFYRLGSVFGPQMIWIALKAAGIFLGFEFCSSFLSL